MASVAGDRSYIDSAASRSRPFFLRFLNRPESDGNTDVDASLCARRVVDAISEDSHREVASSGVRRRDSPRRDSPTTPRTRLKTPGESRRPKTTKKSENPDAAESIYKRTPDVDAIWKSPRTRLELTEEP